MAAVKINGDLLRYAVPAVLSLTDIQANKELVLTAIQHFKPAVNALNHHLSCTTTWLSSLKLLVNKQRELERGPLGGRVDHGKFDYLMDDIDIVLAAVKLNAYWLVDSGKIAKDNFDVVKAAVEIDGYAGLLHASNRLKNDKSIVLTAVGTGQRKHNSRMLAPTCQLQRSPHTVTYSSPVLRIHTHMKYSNYALEEAST